MRKVHIDFESRSAVDIWKSGAWVYSTHPSTKILCICYAIDNGPVKLIDKEDIDLKFMPKELVDCFNDRDTIFVAHNAFFERSITSNILTKHFDVPNISIDRWRCTLAKAGMHGLPKSLEKASLAMRLDNVKDMEGKRAMLKLCKPRPTRKTDEPGKVYWYEDQKDYDILYEYCKKDVMVERCLDHALDDLNDIEQGIWGLDQIMNDRGVCIDREAVNAIISIISEYEEELTSEVKVLTKGYLDKVSQRQRVINWLSSQGVDVPNLQKMTVDDLLEEWLPPKVKRVLEIKQQLSKTSTAKYKAMISAISEDDRLRDTLVYHAASPGRWGGKLVQLHNLPRGNLKDPNTAVDILKDGDREFAQALYPDLMGAVSSCIRGMIIPEKGHDLFVADYAAIEARVLSWLANDIEELRKYYDGIDVYVDMAKKVYGVSKITEEQRALGKVAILGCGYGMGAAKFVDTCKTFGITIDGALSKTVVDTYRDTHREVKSMWYAQEAAAINCVRNNVKVKCGKVSWVMNGDFLNCILPSGRKLYYHLPRLEEVDTPWGEKKLALTYMTVDSQTKQYFRTKTYGGKIVENITQAVARDIMAWAMCRCHTYGYSPILTVHDEIIAEVKGGEGDLDFFIKILTAPVPWSKGCPIDAKGWIGKRYKK